MQPHFFRCQFRVAIFQGVNDLLVLDLRRCAAVGGFERNSLEGRNSNPAELNRIPEIGIVSGGDNRAVEFTIMIRSHTWPVPTGISWHARLLLLAWGILAPAAILVARFFKITPHQDWPRVLDNPFWWRTHWITQSLVIFLSAVALAIIILTTLADSAAGLHQWLGYTVLVFGVFQALSGYFRGSKGGPADSISSEIQPGDHYDMTPWRLAFETVHKSIGYLVLPVAAVAIISGLWRVNGAVWMWVTISSWWIFLIFGSFYLQAGGNAVDTYQAIWGADPSHPGNQMKPRGWKARRLDVPPRRGGDPRT
tara:strand:- start:10491 stop:11417 length:927 start_codon:yes stop_codon:yes gene_type:complete